MHLLSLDEGHESKPLLQEALLQGQPAISPDGRWIAYRSMQSGRYKIFVRPFPNVQEGRWQVPVEAAVGPVWSSNGKELFYRSGDSVSVVPIETEPIFTPGRPRVLFTGNYLRSSFRNYDVAPDGQRLLMIKETPETAAPGGRDELIVVLNWFEELKRLAPPSSRELD